MNRTCKTSGAQLKDQFGVREGIKAQSKGIEKLISEITAEIPQILGNM
jgi:hypothetical protein